MAFIMAGLIMINSIQVYLTFYGQITACYTATSFAPVRDVHPAFRPHRRPLYSRNKLIPILKYFVPTGIIQFNGLG